jgi:hypothetical protein
MGDNIMSKCLIWNTPAISSEDTGGEACVNSPRAGGKYRVTGTAIHGVATLSTDQKKRLTSWLIQQRRAGVEIPKISSYALSEIEHRQLMSFSDKVDAVLLFFGSNIKKIGQNLAVTQAAADSPWAALAAESECEDIGELTCLLHLMVEQKLLAVLSNLTHFSPAPAGWQRIDNLLRHRVDSSQVFVAMWFSELTNDAYANGIAPALRATGYKPVRIDKKEHNNKIDDEIIAEIRRSIFLIADFTCEPKSVRGGVYYEAGFAQGLGIPVIWTCRDISLNDLHFDTRQYAHIVWKTPDDLLGQLKNRIGATIGDGPIPKANV